MGKKRKYAPTQVIIVDPDDVDLVPTITRVDNLSADGRRVRRENHMCYAPPVANARREHLVADDALLYNYANKHEQALPPVDLPATQNEESIHQETRHFATMLHDPPLIEWMEYRQLYVHELLRLDGTAGANTTKCPRCPPARPPTPPTCRCEDCFGGVMVCRHCCVKQHAENPFHRIEVWNGKSFRHVTLQDLGLILQLGHPPGESCMAPVCGPRSFVVLDTNGAHPVNIQFCQCCYGPQSSNRIQQLLRFRLFPATFRDPTTAATFRVMKHFHVTTLQSKINAFDYYMGLMRLTDNTGLGMQWDRLRPFLRMVREWRHLKALKRSGRGHELSGVRGTGAGELCVQCPACPRPGFNLPDNWETVSDELKFLYVLILAIDANFRLKRRAVSNEARDPLLAPGWGYFVNDILYRVFLLGMVEQKDISTCTGFAALLHANNKWSRGYATTGVAMCVCARHGFIMPNAVGDLQKGERFCNVDYVFSSAYARMPEQVKKIVSYDIACQWEKNLLQRLRNLPDHVRLEIPEGELRYAIPKYHFAGHKGKKHNQFSFNLIPGVGRTDGEEIERNWSRHDATSGSTREMGPGSRHDTLEDHFTWANWLKLIGLGKLLQKRLTAALKDRTRYAELLADFKRDLRPENVEQWTESVKKWEADPRLPDPYDITPSGPTEAEIRLQLATEEEEEITMSGTVGLHEVSPSGMLATLLDIEDQQRRFKVKFPTHASSAPSQAAEAITARGALRHRLSSLRAIQAIYMPMVPQLAAIHNQNLNRRPEPTDNAEAIMYPENHPLFLPSALSQEDLDLCTPGLADSESRLREGQMRSALDTLRVHLHIKSRMITYNARNVRHQGACTRAQGCVQKNEEKIVSAAEKYRVAWRANMALCGAGPWLSEWKELKRSDVRTLKGDDGHCPSEGRNEIPWIWMAADKDNSPTGLNEALRIEFLKARARALRFAEEVQLLQEEQRRVLKSLEQTALVWERRAILADQKECPIVRLGAIAYATQQADMHRGLATQFRQSWARLAGGVAAEDPGREADLGELMYVMDPADSDDEGGLIKAQQVVSDDED